MKASGYLPPSLILAAVLFIVGWVPSLPVHAQARTQTPNSARTQNAPAGSAQKGKEAFSAHMCATCHGAEGQGAVGPSLAPPSRVFGDFTQYVRQPSGKMPPFSPQAVSDADLADIYAFLQSANPAPPSNLSSLAGNSQNGGRIYVSYGCYQCHGRVGQGSVQTGGPRIGPPALTIDAFARYIHAPTGNMPPYTSKVVSDQDIADIYAFLKSLPTGPSAKDIPLLNQ